MANAIVSDTKAERIRKVSNAEAEMVAELARVRKQISELEESEAKLKEVLNRLFGKQDTSSAYDLLVNRNRELARIKWKSRKDIDRKKLAENYPEAFEACQKVTTYAELVTLHS